MKTEDHEHVSEDALLVDLRNSEIDLYNSVFQCNELYYSQNI